MGASEKTSSQDSKLRLLLILPSKRPTPGNPCPGQFALGVLSTTLAALAKAESRPRLLLELMSGCSEMIPPPPKLELSTPGNPFLGEFKLEDSLAVASELQEFCRALWTFLQMGKCRNAASALKHRPQEGQARRNS
mmetsp:Transcript_61324/g.134366  ORF Transcript_61324/g.134366 Transcript_61324/m.134366 type:complete len:136 (-) Transcript_61324:524-931(-)